MSAFLILVAVLGVIGLVWLSNRVTAGLYILAAVSFCSGWRLHVTGTAVRDFFALPLFTALASGPVVDFWVLVLAIALLIGLLAGWYRFDREQARTLLPFIGWYALFIILAAVSAWFVYHGQQFSSFKYILRPEIFAFVCFFAFPFLLLQKREVLLRFVWVWWWFGIVATLYGLSSLIFANDLYTWVTPYAIFGFAPMGENHNQMAETLLAIIPLGWLLWAVRRKKSDAPVVFGVLLVMMLTAFLTLSRSLWLVMGAQMLVMAYWYRAPLVKAARQLHRGWWYAAGAVVCGVVAYMAVYLFSAVPASSSSSRQIMNRIVVEAVVARPLVGYGPGTFITYMQETPEYVQAFSEQLDAHGFVQKIIFEQGILGLIAWLLFMASVLGYVYQVTTLVRGKEKVLAARIFLVTACGVVAFQLFNTSYYLATLWLPLAVCVAGATLLRLKRW